MTLVSKYLTKEYIPKCPTLLQAKKITLKIYVLSLYVHQYSNQFKIIKRKLENLFAKYPWPVFGYQQSIP